MECTEGTDEPFIDFLFFFPQPVQFRAGSPAHCSAWGPTVIQCEPDVKCGRPPQIQMGVYVSDYYLMGVSE